jgi:hypothetical protein
MKLDVYRTQLPTPPYQMHAVGHKHRLLPSACIISTDYYNTRTIQVVVEIITRWEGTKQLDERNPVLVSATKNLFGNQETR